MTKLIRHYDVIVVGAGVQGLIAAKTFLQCHPALKLGILDSAESIGGVWRKEALYPELRTNNLRGTFEFNDFSLPDDLGVRFGEHLPGAVVNEYLCRYAERHNLLEYCTFGTKVEGCERVQDQWEVQCLSMRDQSSRYKITCEKLVIATGLSSSPAPLELKGSEDFQSPIINFASLAKEHQKLLDPSIKHVAVFGGGKAAYDTIYLLAVHGKRITWIIRASGHGPVWMTHPKAWIGPTKLWLERVVTARLISFLSPCLWGPADGFGWMRSFFHNTQLGRWIVQAFYSKLSYETLYQQGLLDDDIVKPLIPDENASWYGAGFSVLNYPTNILDFVRNGQVQIVRKDIETLGAPNLIHFSDDSPAVQVDALICTTGWSYALPFDLKPYTLHASLGIPSLEYSKPQTSAWAKYEAAADAEVLSRFPSLARAPQPKHGPSPTRADLSTDHVPTEVEKIQQMTPWRLWRGVAPPGLAAAPEKERSIVFLGMLLSIHTVLRSEMQALWAWAWMNGFITPSSSFPLTARTKNEDVLPPPPPEEVDPLLTPWLQETSSFTTPADPHGLRGPKQQQQQQQQQQQKASETYRPIFYDTALFNRGCRWRAPYGYGSRYPDFMFDGLPYFDLLLRDLGLRFWRKGRTMLGEMFSGGYLPKDYRGVVEEWKAKHADHTFRAVEEKM